MPAALAAIMFCAGIGLLLVLARNPDAKTTGALWVAIAWMAIASSRNLAQWLQLSSPVTSDEHGAAYLEGNSTDRYFLALLLVLAVLALVVRGQRVLEILRHNPFVPLYFLFCGLSVLWSDHPDVAFKRWFRAIGDLTMALLILTEIDWAAAMDRFLTRLGFVLLPCSVLMIRYYSEVGRIYNPFDGGMSWTGVTTSKNLLGMISMLFGLASAFRLIEEMKKPRYKRYAGPFFAHLSLLLVALYLLYVAHSATSVACFALGSMIICCCNLDAIRRRTPLLVLVTIGPILFACSALFFGIGAVVIEGLGRDTTLTGRTEIWNLVLKMAANPLLGAGYESFWLGERLEKIRAIYYNNVNQAHNGYLEVYINVGMIGVFLLIGLLVRGYAQLMLRVKEGRPYASLLLAYLVVAMTYNLSEAGFKMMHPVWIVALLSVMVRHTNSKPDPDPLVRHSTATYSWYEIGTIRRSAG